MKLKRRNFLAAMVTAPAAAKQSANDIVRSALTQMGKNGVGVMTFRNVPIGDEPNANDDYNQKTDRRRLFRSYINQARRALEFIRRSGIPEWKLAEMREFANGQMMARTGFDADIAVLHSTSPSWKARKQRDRDFEFIKASSLATVTRQAERMAYQARLERVSGYDFEWYR